MPAAGAWGQATGGSSKGGGGLGLILPYEHCAALRRICMGGCCSACRGVWGGNTEPACSPPFTSEGLDSMFFFSVAPPLTAAVKLIKCACCFASAFSQCFTGRWGFFLHRFQFSHCFHRPRWMKEGPSDTYCWSSKSSSGLCKIFMPLRTTCRATKKIIENIFIYTHMNKYIYIYKYIYIR